MSFTGPIIEVYKPGTSGPYIVRMRADEAKAKGFPPVTTVEETPAFTAPAIPAHPLSHPRRTFAEWLRGLPRNE